MYLLQTNRRRGHKFLMSGALFGHSMARLVSMIMRIVWSCYPHNLRIGIAANVFAAAGVLILYIVDLFFAERVLRAAHPRIGWHPAIKIAFTAFFVLVVLVLAMIITVVIQSFYSLNPNTHRIDKDVQIFAQAYLLTVAFLPIPVVLAVVASPRRDNRRLDKFGTGRWRSKIVVLLAASFLLTLGRAFVATGTFGPMHLASNPPWYDSKASFFIWYFMIEIIVTYSFLILRVDQRFHVPDGSKRHGDYSNGVQTETKAGDLESASPQPPPEAHAKAAAAGSQSDEDSSEESRSLQKPSDKAEVERGREGDADAAR